MGENSILDATSVAPKTRSKITQEDFDASTHIIITYQARFKLSCDCCWVTTSPDQNIEQNKITTGLSTRSNNRLKGFKKTQLSEDVWVRQRAPQVRSLSQKQMDEIESPSSEEPLAKNKIDANVLR